MSRVVNIAVEYTNLKTTVGFEIISGDGIKLSVVSPISHVCKKDLKTLSAVAKHLHLEDRDHDTFVSLFNSTQQEATAKFIVTSPKIECDHSHLRSN
jgi:hypothetical protein